MANYTQLKAAIRAAIYDNITQAITGAILQDILIKMVDELGQSYVKPAGGIPEEDLAQAVRQAIDKALSAYQKPDGGIPAADIASGVIPDVSQFITNTVDDLVNYYKKTETYTQEQVNSLIGAINQFKFEIYPSLGDITTPSSNVLYLIGPSGSGADKYEEYVYANGEFTKIGDTSIDLSGYLRYTPQTLTEEEKAQARHNIGAAAEGALTQNDIADNLTTEDPTKVLSAKQGKVLAGQVSQLGQEVTAIKHGNLAKPVGEQITVVINVATLDYVDNIYALANGTAFTTSQGYRVSYLPITNNGTINYKLGSGNSPTQCAIALSDTVPAAGVSFSMVAAREANKEGSIDVTEGKYLCVIGFVGSPTYWPQSLVYKKGSDEPINIFDELGEKSPDSEISSDSVWGAIEEITAAKIPFLIESASYFWMRKNAVHFSQNNPFKISGSANSRTLAIGSGGEVSSVLTNDDKNTAIVIKHDNGHCSLHLLTDWDAGTLEVYPALSEVITDGELVPLLADAQHLTKLGFHAWAEHLYAANPRFCEKNKYIIRYAPTGAYVTPPFSQFGGGLALYPGSRNDNSTWMQQYGSNGAFYIPYSDKSTIGEYGVQWEMSCGGKKGYLETFIGTTFESSYPNTFDKDSGYELHIEVYADGVLIHNYLKATNFVERICVPFEESQNLIKLKIYYTHLRAHKETISIGETTLWVNEQKNIPTTLFPKYSILSWFMASWGEYSYDRIVTDRDAANFPDAAGYPTTDQSIDYKQYKQGASGEAMRGLISVASGVQMPLYNRSKAGTTTRFGKAWWPFLVQPYCPNIMVTSFGVNDYHTNTNPGTFSDVLDPYGNIIDMSTPILPEEYAQNIKAMVDMCHKNNIVFVHAEGSIAQSMDWLIGFENNFSEQIFNP